MILLSNYLGLDKELDDKDVFNQILDFDANYFINIKRIRDTSTKEFENSYKKINKFFSEICILLKHSTGSEDVFYKKALKKFKFPEVSGIGLGYSNGVGGSGFGNELTKKIIEDAKKIIDSGVIDPEIFHLIGLFESNVGPDRLSDMFATLIIEDIKNYTMRIYDEININKDNYPHLTFDKGFLINPYKNEPILLLPKDILHELPIAKDWEDIDRVCKEIENIKREVNSIVCQNWSKLNTSNKKMFIRDSIVSDADILNKLINDYKNDKVEKYDFEKDPLGTIVLAKYISKLNKSDFIDDDISNINTYEVTKIICNRFKNLIENKKAYQLLYTDNWEPRKEKIAQQLFVCIADSYCKANNLDLSPECNIGRGPVDFKISSGDRNKTLVEIKLTTNSQLVHGLEVQIQEYSKAEETNNLIYLVIDNGGPKSRIEKMFTSHRSIPDGVKKPDLIYIDARPKESASKY